MLRRVSSAACWTLAVVAGIATGAGFMTGGVVCGSGKATHCPPQTLQLIVGVAATCLFGFLGAVLWKPRPKKRPEAWDWRYRG